jgi:hypothetical protein
MAMTKAEKAAVDALKLKIALRWPEEQVKAPLFRFGDYDKLYGIDEREIEFGVYFVANGIRVERVEITKATSGWRRFAFNGKDYVVRGSYYRDEADAWVSVLWHQRREAARELKPYWDRLEAAREAKP